MDLTYLPGVLNLSRKVTKYPLQTHGECPLSGDRTNRQQDPRHEGAVRRTLKDGLLGSLAVPFTPSPLALLSRNSIKRRDRRFLPLSSTPSTPLSRTGLRFLGTASLLPMPCPRPAPRTAGRANAQPPSLVSGKARRADLQWALNRPGDALFPPALPSSSPVLRPLTPPPRPISWRPRFLGHWSREAIGGERPFTAARHRRPPDACFVFPPVTTTLVCAFGEAQPPPGRCPRTTPVAPNRDCGNPPLSSCVRLCPLPWVLPISTRIN